MQSGNVLINSMCKAFLENKILTIDDIRHFDEPKTNSEEFKQIVDLAVRQSCLKISTDNLPGLLQFALKAARSNIAGISLPVQLVGDVFSTRILSDCELVFNELIQQNTSNWKSLIFYNTSKNVLLRCVNDLLKRASKVQKTEFCGRIQMFLANFYPITEKSGLNLMSHFNSDNVTIFDSSNSLISNSSQTDIFVKESFGVLVDVALHRRFWSLQSFFSDPNICLSNEGWKKFSSCSSEVLNVFASFRLSEPSFNGIQILPKYLTSEKLLDMQLSDPTIRRHILIQFLILFDYLRGPVKFRPENLSADRLIWVDNARQQVKHLLRETPPDGVKFEQEICRILNQDMNIWNKWKNEGCPNFIKQPIDLSITQLPEHFSKIGVQSYPETILNSEISTNKSSLISAELYTRIQQASSNMKLDAFRKTCPLLDWQVLRLFRWRRPPKPAARNIQKIDEYLSAVYGRISSECKHPPLKRPASDDCEDEIEGETSKG